MRPHRVPWSLVALVALAPSASAGGAPFDEAHAFPTGPDGLIDVFYAAQDLRLAAPAGAAIAAFGTNGWDVTGIATACWRNASGLRCASDGDGPITLEVAAGAAFAFRPEAPVEWRYTGSHGLATFVLHRLDPTREPSAAVLVASPDGEVAATQWDAPVAAQFVLVPGTAPAVVRQGAAVLTSLTAGNEILLLQGALSLSPLPAGFVLAPFAPGSVAHLSRAPAGDLYGPTRWQGMRDELGRVEGAAPDAIRPYRSMLERLDAAMAPLAGERLPALGPGATVAGEILNPASVLVDGSAAPGALQVLSMRRYEAVSVANEEGTMRWTGTGLLASGTGDEGSPWRGSAPFLVAGALALAVAVAAHAIVARRHPKPPVAGWANAIRHGLTAAAVLAVLIMWDVAFRQVLGTSVLTTHEDGPGLALLTAEQLGLLLFCLAWFAVPTGLALATIGRLASEPIRTVAVLASGAAALLVGLAVGVAALPAILATAFAVGA